MRGLLAALGLAAAAPAMAQDVSVATLREVADRFDASQLTGNVAAMDELAADDLIFIESSGAKLGKQEFIAGWVDPKAHFDPVTITNRYFVPLGPDSGVAGGEAVLSGTADGERFSSHIRFADTFRRTGGKWRAVHIQVTRVPAD